MTAVLSLGSPGPSSGYASAEEDLQSSTSSISPRLGRRRSFRSGSNSSGDSLSPLALDDQFGFLLDPPIPLSSSYDPFSEFLTERGIMSPSHEWDEQFFKNVDLDIKLPNRTDSCPDTNDVKSNAVQEGDSDKCRDNEKQKCDDKLSDVKGLKERSCKVNSIKKESTDKKLHIKQKSAALREKKGAKVSACNELSDIKIKSESNVDGSSCLKANNQSSSDISDTETYKFPEGGRGGRKASEFDLASIFDLKQPEFGINEDSQKSTSELLEEFESVLDSKAFSMSAEFSNELPLFESLQVDDGINVDALASLLDEEEMKESLGCSNTAEEEICQTVDITTFPHRDLFGDNLLSCDPSFGNFGSSCEEMVINQDNDFHINGLESITSSGLTLQGGLLPTAQNSSSFKVCRITPIRRLLPSGVLVKDTQPVNRFPQNSLLLTSDTRQINGRKSFPLRSLSDPNNSIHSFAKPLEVKGAISPQSQSINARMSPFVGNHVSPQSQWQKPNLPASRAVLDHHYCGPMNGGVQNYSTETDSEISRYSTNDEVIVAPPGQLLKALMLQRPRIPLQGQPVYRVSNQLSEPILGQQAVIPGPQTSRQNQSFKYQCDSMGRAVRQQPGPGGEQQGKPTIRRSYSELDDHRYSSRLSPKLQSFPSQSQTYSTSCQPPPNKAARYSSPSWTPEDSFKTSGSLLETFLTTRQHLDANLGSDNIIQSSSAIDHDDTASTLKRRSTLSWSCTKAAAARSREHAIRAEAIGRAKFSSNQNSNESVLEQMLTDQQTRIVGQEDSEVASELCSEVDADDNGKDKSLPVDEYMDCLAHDGGFLEIKEELDDAGWREESYEQGGVDGYVLFSDQLIKEEVGDVTNRDNTWKPSCMDDRILSTELEAIMKEQTPNVSDGDTWLQLKLSEML